MQFNGKIKDNNKGFTLVELIITVVILALVVAPFLSSFITASKTNVKSKKIEKANEIGEHVIEEFKASSIDYMKTKYKLNVTNKAINASKKQYTKGSDKYSVKDLRSTAFTTGFSDKYTVDIDMYPEQIAVNSDDAIPQIDKLDRSKCAVLVDNLTKFDQVGTASREINAVISYDSSAKKFVVDVTVSSKNNAGAMLGLKKMSWNYDTVPSVYMIYNPKSEADKFNIAVNITDTNYDEFNAAQTDDTKKLDKIKDKASVYLICQKNNSGSVPKLSADQVSFTENGGASRTLTTLYKQITNNNDSQILKHTVIYSNLYKNTVSIVNSDTRTDKQDTVNETVKLIKLETIYNIDVTVKYNGGKVSTFNSTKSSGK